MNGLIERIQRMETQIGALIDDKFEYKSRTKDLEMKLSQSEERIEELGRNLQEQMEELGCCIKEDAFKKLKRKVSVLGQQQQQLKKQNQDTNDKFQRLDKLQLLLNSIMLGKSSTNYRNSLVDMRSGIDNPRDRFDDYGTACQNRSPTHHRLYSSIGSNSGPSHFQLSDSDTEECPQVRHSTCNIVLDPKTEFDTENIPKNHGNKLNEATDTAPIPKIPKRKGLARISGVMTGKTHRHNDPSKETFDGNRKQLRRMSLKTRARALHSNVSLGDSYLSFEKGDLLEIHGAHSLSTSSEEWLEATHLKTKKRGLIPSNFVIEDDTWLKRQEWLVEYDCRYLEKKLLLPGNSKGTFLVTEHPGDKYVLSVRDTDLANGAPSVKRYGVHKKDSDKSYFIRPNKTFQSLDDLISHYQSMSDGLCCTLTTPCPRILAVVPLSQLEIKRDNLQLFGQLGVGGRFTETMRGTLHDVLDVTVKIRPKSMSAKDFLNEAKIMCHLRHERLVQLLAVVSAEEPFYIITEFMIYGTLQSFLRSEKGSSLKLNSLIAINSQIAEGMAYLERRNVVHRDLRAANILVGQDFEVKVANFALSRILDHDKFVDITQGLYLPAKWLAPEAVRERQVNGKADVWSFGVLMYEIITLGKAPYPEMSHKEVFDKLEKGWRMEKPTDGPIEVTDFYFQMMLKCWHRVPALRPSFEFLHFTFHNYYNFDDIYDEPPCACGE